MQIDPTKDFSGIDLSKEENQILWNYCELVKHLVILSIPAEEQKEIMGYGTVTEEMAIDFDCSFAPYSQNYVDKQLLTEEQQRMLELLNTFFDDRTGNGRPGFWDDDCLGSHPDWDKVREMAKDILTEMGYDNLILDLERTIEKTQSNKGEPLVIETTMIRLKKR